MVLKVLKDPVPLYRLAHSLYNIHVPVLPALLTYFIRFWFSCYLPHTAQIGRCCVVGYGGLGVVIHGDVIIGNSVHIGHGVTLGGNAVDFGVPTVEDDVYIGCGARILGPVHIGHGSIVGANAVVTHDVPSRCVVAGIPARIVKEDVDMHQYLYHLRQFK